MWGAPARTDPLASPVPPSVPPSPPLSWHARVRDLEEHEHVAVPHVVEEEPQVGEVVAVEEGALPLQQLDLGAVF